MQQQHQQTHQNYQYYDHHHQQHEQQQDPHSQNYSDYHAEQQHQTASMYHDNNYQNDNNNNNNEPDYYNPTSKPPPPPPIRQNQPPIHDMAINDAHNFIQENQNQQSQQNDQSNYDQHNENENNNNNNNQHSQLTSSSAPSPQESLPPSSSSLRPFLFDTNAWALRFSVTGLLCGVLTVAVPQWFYTIQNSTSYGLRSSCIGNRCTDGGAIDFVKLRSELNCDSSCGGSGASDSFGDLKLRWRVIEGFGWLAVVLQLIVVLCVVFAFSYPVRPTAMGAIHVLTSIGAIFAIGISWGALYMSVGCGTNCFELGASAITSGVSCLLMLVMSFTGCLGNRSERLGTRRAMGRITTVGCLAALTLQLFALLSPKWIFIRAAANTALPVTNWGIIYQCLRFSCQLLDIPGLLDANTLDLTCPRGPDASWDARNQMWIGLWFVAFGTALSLLLAIVTRSGGTLEFLQIQEFEKHYDKNGNTKASRHEDEKRRRRNRKLMEQHEESVRRHHHNQYPQDSDDDDYHHHHFVHFNNNNNKNQAAVTAVAVALPVPPPPATRKEAAVDTSMPFESPTIRLTLTIFIFISTTVANVVFFYTFNFSMFCGKQFCEFVGDVTNQSTSCDMGVAAVASLIFNILFTILVTMEIFQRSFEFCSRSYETMEKSTKKMISDFLGKGGALSRQKGDAEEMRKMLSGEENNNNFNSEKYEIENNNNNHHQQEHDDDEDEIHRQEQERNRIADEAHRKFTEKISLFTRTKAEFLDQYTRQYATIAICNWFLWLVFLLSAFAGCVSLVAVFSNSWASSSTFIYGPFQYCQPSGRLCFSYQSGDCPNGEFGSEKARHFLVGGMSLFGSGFVFLNAILFTFSFSPTIRLIRLGCGFIGFLCLLFALIMWFQRTYSCTPSVDDGTSVSVSFFMEVGAAGAAFLSFLLTFADVLAFYLCSASGDQQEQQDEADNNNPEVILTRRIAHEKAAERKNHADQARRRREEVEKEKLKKFMEAFPPPPPSPRARKQPTAATTITATENNNRSAGFAPSLPPPKTQSQKQQYEQNNNNNYDKNQQNNMSAIERATSALVQHESVPRYDNQEEDEHQQQQQEGEENNYHFTKDSDPAEIGLEGADDWHYDEAAGYWWSEQMGLYYDHSSKAYGNPITGEWLVWNEETGAYDPM